VLHMRACMHACIVSALHLLTWMTPELNVSAGGSPMVSAYCQPAHVCPAPSDGLLNNLVDSSLLYGADCTPNDKAPEGGLPKAATGACVEYPMSAPWLPISHPGGFLSAVPCPQGALPPACMT
jgi:hypothetical protein